MIPFPRHPKLQAVTVLGVIGAYAYVQTYFVLSPEDRSGMLRWYVIALAVAGWCVLVLTGFGICALIDKVRGPRPQPPGFEVMAPMPKRDDQKGPAARPSS